MLRLCQKKTVLVIGKPEASLENMVVFGRIILKRILTEWIHLAQDIVQWRNLVNTVNKFRDP
jgi:hypothetical protein